jgi:predicted ATP-dependent endonuclease of OLD family
MHFNDFEVHNYKVIDDTKPVKVDERVTALVGKNESGKSSILRSLWKSRNVAGAKFDKLFDYPRDRYSRERKGTQKATVIRFKLDPEEIEEIVSTFPRRPSKNPEIMTLTTFYVGEDQTYVR